jgi:hypothetical protein
VDVQEGNIGAAGANVAANFGTSMLRHVCARGVASSDKGAMPFHGPTMMKTCPFCKFDIPVDTLVCGHCRKDQPIFSVPKTPEQIQSEKIAKRGCLIFAGAILAIFLVVGIVNSISNSIKKDRISAEVDRKNKIEQQSSKEAAKAILPGINHYADLLEGKIRISAVDYKKEAGDLRGLSDTANKQVAKLEALGWGDLSTAKAWRQLSAMFITDAQVMEAIFSKMKPSERNASAQLHRKLAAVLQKHADEGFINAYSLDSDLYVPSGNLDSSPRAPISTGSHLDFIKETSDLPSSAQEALDKIYKVDPARARELSRQAHEAGVQNLPDQ